MANQVEERAFLPAVSLPALAQALQSLLGRYGVRANQTVPKDGSELVDMNALAHVTVPQLVANTNDLDLGSQISVARLSTDASRNLTGITDGATNAPGEGRTLTLINVGSFDLVLIHQSGLSAAGNRFAIGANITLVPDDGISLFYDVNDLRWRRRSTF